MKKIFMALALASLALAGGKVIITLDCDPSAIREFTGRILVKKPLYSIMEVGSKKYYLHIAPEFYLKRKGVIMDAGSKIWVKGMVVKVNKDYHIFAKEIKISGKKIAIRTEDGTPYWRLEMRERRRRKGVRNNRNSFR